MEAAMAHTEPLPFVPATWMEGNARSGGRRRRRALDVVKAELHPEELEAVKITEASS